MLLKKVLRIALMTVALMSYSIAALAEDKKEGKGSEIFTSLLQTPPPGYIIEKSFGNIGVVKEHNAVFHINRENILETIAAAIKEAEETLKKLGGTALLAERIDTQIANGDGSQLIVIIQGEAVLLKPAGK